MNDLRYQPTPFQGSLAAWPSWLGSKGPAIAQSCGRRTFCQSESSNATASAPSASPLLNFQSRLNDSVLRGDGATSELAAATREEAPANVIETARRTSGRLANAYLTARR